ncbi:hypothetical protein BASA81_007861 [Batrachochytrium salamandrivorans]|nr:hypothetical protein BASA81_007861 [Batrachochytrium salamandrivorans]
MVLGDDWLFNLTEVGPALKHARESGWVSPLFPLVFVALPMFWLGALLVYWVEGPVKQKFNLSEFTGSVKSQAVLAFLWSCGPVCRVFLDNSKVDMTLEEYVWKGAAAAIIVDAAFYWVHRAMHDIPWLRQFHAKHHALLAKHTVWGGVDDDLVEVLCIFAYLNLPFCVLTVTPECIVIYIAVGAVQTALMHGTTIGGWWAPPWPTVGAIVHHGHHQTITKNYGGVFVFWDHLMGTNKPLGEKAS